MSSEVGIEFRLKAYENANSMRVYQPGPSETDAASATRTSESQRIGTLQKPSSGADGAGSGSDRVQLSSLARQVADTEQALPVSRAGRVKQLTEVYQAGNYNIDSHDLSRRIVDQWLTNADHPQM